MRTSPLYKFLVDLEDLTKPIVASKGIREALQAVGALEAENDFFYLGERARRSPCYEVSGARALEVLEADNGWRSGDIVYAEAHCMALPLGVWVDAMIAPLPERLAALIEFAPSKRRAETGFWVRLVRLEDMPAIWP